MEEYEYKANAMGTDIDISIVTTSSTDAEKGQQTTIETIAVYEQCFSRFIHESELSILNAEKSIHASSLFYCVFTEAIRAYHLSDGLFNPLVQIARLGYVTDFKKLPKQAAVQNNTPYNINIADIEINEQSRKITLQEGQALDFGGFLKGYLAEKIATSLMKTFPSYQGVIINLGGDLHAKGLDADNTPFVFDILNPVTKEDISIPIQDKSLATSGTYKRVWDTKNGKHNHILDKTGMKNPESNIISASTIHPHGTESEVYTKMLITHPEKETFTTLTDASASYILVTSEGKIIKNI